jgi:predicted outer membrane repeat protein
VTVERRHTVQTSPSGGESIARYYDVSVTGTNSGLDATLTHHYADSELNGRPESDLNLFASDNGGSTWRKEGADGRDTGTNTVTTTGIDALGGERWTLGTGLVQTTIYVDESATGANDGTSWEDAYVHLQDALDKAKNKPSRTFEVRVAEGTYFPDEDKDGDHADGDATESFTIAENNVQMFGGYPPGGGTRDPAAHPTVLSGDIDQDDVTDADGVTRTPGDIDGSNSMNVLYLEGGGTNITNNTIIDGVLVTGGEASGSAFSEKRGAGLFCNARLGNECSPVVRDATFIGNRADDGGGSGDGAAIFNHVSNGGISSPTIVDVAFVNNEAIGNGGAIYNNGANGISSPRIVNAVFANNTAVNDRGGAIFNAADGSSGGTSSPRIINATFTGNTAGASEGAISNDEANGGAADPTIQNSILWGNQPGDVSQGSGVTIEYTIIEEGCSANCNAIFAGPPRFEYPPRPAGDDGIFGTDDDGLHVTPGSPALDAGIDPSMAADPADITGTERPKDSDDDGTDDFDLGAYEGPRDQARTIYVDASATGANDGTSWADADTRLQDPNSIASGALDYATDNDEIRIAEGVYTPAGETASFTITGLQDGLIVKGGYDGSGSRDPSSFPTVLSGDINDDDTNKTPAGVTPTASDTVGPNSHHVLVYNGGDQIGPNVTSNITSSTVLNGVIVTGGQADGSNDLGGGLFCDGRGAGNECSPSIENVRFVGNTASFGGAMFNEGTNGLSSPQIANSRFENNTADASGGAIHNDGNDGGNSSPTIVGTTFIRNAGTGTASDGGAIYNNARQGTSSPTIREVVFTENTATSDGGALFNSGNDGGTSSPVIQDAVFVGNTAEKSGGALYSLADNDVDTGISSPNIVNAVFARNTSIRPGGAIANVANDGIVRPSIVNATFSGNAADSSGGAIANLDRLGGTVEPTITNTVLWGNTADANNNGVGSGDEIYNKEGGVSPTLSHTLIEGALAGISENNGSSTTDDGGNLFLSPQFSGAGTLSGDDGTLATVDDSLALGYDSPAFDAGTNAPFQSGGVAENVTTDLTGAARRQDLDGDGTATVNIGAYESVVPAPPTVSMKRVVSVTGAGVSGTVNPRGADASVRLRLYPTGRPEQDTLLKADTRTGAVTQRAETTARSLTPTTEYTVELTADNAEGGPVTDALSFETPPAPALKKDDPGASIEMTYTTPGPAPTLTDTSFFARKGGGDEYQSLSISEVEGFSAGTEGELRLRAQLPGSLIGLRGVDYYAAVTEDADQYTVPAGGEPQASSRPLHLPVSFESFSPPASVTEDLSQQETYRMVSIPAAVDPTAALTERYGPYKPAEWRVLQWDGSEGTYREFPDLDSTDLQAGNAFWLVTEQGTPLSLGTGRTVDASTRRRVALDPGWNQVGTPFPYAVSWDTVRAESGFTAAELDGPYRRGPDGYQTDAALQPWRGYFVFNATGETDTLSIPPVDASAQKAQSQRLATRTGRPGKSSAGYTLRVTASTKSGTSTALMGLRAGAKAGRDRHDIAKPPSVRPVPQVSVTETVGERSVPHAKSVKPAGGSGQTWTLRLRRPARADAPSSVRLDWSASGSLPEGQSRYVIDPSTETRVASGKRFSLDKGETRRLKVIVGTERYARKQSAAALQQYETALRGNYPNPFDEATTLEYTLGREREVTMQVYNVLGQRVETLVDARTSAGLHTVTWDGTNRYGDRVGSGVYFVRMEAGPETETQKVVLVR